MDKKDFHKKKRFSQTKKKKKIEKSFYEKEEILMDKKGFYNDSKKFS